MGVALRIEVDTLPGLLDGVPAILECLAGRNARASFYFATGVDRSCRFRPVSLARGATPMRSALGAGHECGVLSGDPVRWREQARDAGAEWTEAAMRADVERFTDIVGSTPRAHAAAGWQMNRHALRLTQRLGFGHASDGRGSGPHLPVWRGELVRCPQIPTTLATLEELLATKATGVDEAVGLLLAATVPDEGAGERMHVHTMSAVDRADARFGALRALLEGWSAQGHPVCALGDLLAAAGDLPRCNVAPEDRPECRGHHFAQGDEFLGDIRLADTA